MIEWLALFGETESNGVTRILYSKERMSAQQAMKAEDGKKLIIYFDRVCFRGASGGIILTSSHMETDKDGVEYDGAYGVVSHIVGLRRYTVEIISKSDHAGTTPIPTGRMLSSGFGIQCSEWHR
ncbi:hypothetical protein [Peribacillus frigoritolerans]|uniref:Uncharacterized protein n=1 Tax=Peribacillus frigoritolerans TaxID=450367 RepID=A0AAJ1VA98_9BACI|nr:hypothetical protein [Peribacillus frigoritolerans]MDM5282927.1 hypothetical protein [Peribacillus frigoritolerans]